MAPFFTWVNFSSALTCPAFVTSFAIETLPRDEMTGVLAHELAHHLGFHTVALSVRQWLSLPIFVLAGIGFFLQNVATAATRAFVSHSSALSFVGRLISGLLKAVAWGFLSALLISNRIAGRAELTGIDLGALVAGSSLADSVTVQAKINGVLPFSMGEAGFRIEDGFAVATGPGRLSIKRSALTGVAVGGATAEAARPNAVQDFAYQALENLAFDTMEAKIASRPEGRLGVVFACETAFHVLSFLEAWLTLWLLTGVSAPLAAFVLDTFNRID